MIKKLEEWLPRFCKENGEYIRNPKKVDSILANCLEELFPLNDFSKKIPRDTLYYLNQVNDSRIIAPLDKPLDLGAMGALDYNDQTGFTFYFRARQDSEVKIPFFLHRFRMFNLLTDAINLDDGTCRVPLDALLLQIAIFSQQLRRIEGVPYSDSPWLILLESVCKELPLTNEEKLSPNLEFMEHLDESILPAYKYWKSLLAEGGDDFLIELKRQNMWQVGLAESSTTNRLDVNEATADFSFISIGPDGEVIEGTRLPWNARQLYLIMAAALSPPNSRPFQLLLGVRRELIRAALDRVLVEGSPISRSMNLLQECMKEVRAKFIQTPRHGVLVEGTSGANYIISGGCTLFNIGTTIGICEQKLGVRNPASVNLNDWIPLCIRTDFTVPIGDRVTSLILGLSNDEQCANDIDDIGVLLSQINNQMSDEQINEFQERYG